MWGFRDRGSDFDFWGSGFGDRGWSSGFEFRFLIFGVRCSGFGFRYRVSAGGGAAGASHCARAAEVHLWVAGVGFRGSGSGIVF